MVGLSENQLGEFAFVGFIDEARGITSTMQQSLPHVGKLNMNCHRATAEIALKIEEFPTV